MISAASIGRPTPAMPTAANVPSPDAPAPVSGPTATPSSAVIVGAGLTGTMTAIKLAQQGHTVDVIEKRGAEASRRNLLNLAPAVADALNAIDGGSRELTGALVPIQQFIFDDRVAGEQRVRAGSEYAFEQVHGANRRGLMDALVSPPEDPRLWSRVRLSEIENGLRRYAEQHYPDKVRFHWNSTVDAINGAKLPGKPSPGGDAPIGAITTGPELLSKIPPTADGVTVDITGEDGATSSLKGAFLVYATGGGNPFGIKPKLDPDRAHFVGGEFPANDDPVKAVRVRERLHELPGATDRAVNGDLKWATTIGLNYPRDKSLLWAEIAQDPKSLDPATLRSIIAERAGLVGMKGEQIGDPIPVSVQLGVVEQAVDVDRRIILAGDELGPPYFPTSSGAGRGLAVSAPQVAEAVHKALQPGADVASVLKDYEREAIADHAAIQQLSRAQLAHDLHEESPAAYDFPRTGGNGPIPSR